jgi:hypothetical protein
MQKIYLSRAQTRAMAAYEPIGDAFGGAAYGEKNDPVSAAFSIYGMFSAAEAGFAAMTMMQGLAFAGSALSLVGNVTGNADLMKIGAVAGLAGFAGSAGLFGDSVQNWGKAATDAGAGTGGATLSQTTAPGVQTPVVDGVATGSPTGAELPAGVQPSGAVTTPVGNSPSVDVQAINTPGAPAGLNAAPSMPGAPTIGTPGYDPMAPLGAPASATPGVTPGDPTLKPPATGPGTQMVAPPKDPGLLSQAMKWTKENPTLAMMAGKAIEGGVDVATGKTQAYVDYYKAKAAEAQRSIDLQKERQSRLNQGYMTSNANVNVNPNANLQFSRPGLITGARG